jgi:cysteine desulfurase
LSHYLDHASTSPLRPEAGEAIVSWISNETGSAGDPARVHSAGRLTRHAIESAREQVALLLGARGREVVFTSGATESINMAVHGAAAARPGRAIVAAGVEHSAVRDSSARAAPVLEAAVDRSGRIDPSSVAELLAEEEVGLVHCQLANHEVGTLQPCAEIVEMCRAAGVLVHVDAAAAIGHVPFDFAGLGADLCSVSGHKLGAPSGTGVLLIRRGLRLDPLVVGGEQERARRAGHENALGIVGLGAVAAALADGRAATESEADLRRTNTVRVILEDLSDVELLGPHDAPQRLPSLVSAAVAGVESEAVLLALDRAGISVHSGSACSSESLQPSPVLAAMGVDADRSLRISVGWSTTDEDIAALADTLPQVVERLRALARRSRS